MTSRSSHTKKVASKTILSENSFGRQASSPCPRDNHAFFYASVLGCQSARENNVPETRCKHSPPIGSQRLEPFPPRRGRREKRASHVRRRQVNTAGLACNLPISRARLCAWEEKRKEKKSSYLSTISITAGASECSVGGGRGKSRLQTKK